MTLGTMDGKTTLPAEQASVTVIQQVKYVNIFTIILINFCF